MLFEEQADGFAAGDVEVRCELLGAGNFRVECAAVRQRFAAAASEREQRGHRGDCHSPATVRRIEKNSRYQ